ncbi:17958_t:CDS:1, partial [Dentiscutata erythropus]
CDDIDLASYIYMGHRPEIISELPSDYKDMMERPNASEVAKFATNTLEKLYNGEIIIPA